MRNIKKIIIWVIFVYIFIQLFQIGFRTEEANSDQIKVKKIPYNEFNYGDYKTVKLLHSDTNQVEELPLDIYLYGVVSSEMPVSFENEALRAQAVVARTYTIYQIRNNQKHSAENADICDNPLCCQAWISKENRMARWDKNEAETNWIKIENCVNSTIGKVILYNGEPIKAFFHSNSGGSTESSLNVWGGDIEYLQSVQTIGEDNYSSYMSEACFSKDDLIVKMRDNFEDFEIDFQKEDCIKTTQITESGRVQEIKIGNKAISGVEARRIFGLKSTKFDVKLDKDEIIFSVFGYGHGVGLSQCGSDSLAKQGKNYEEIINHYYQDVTIMSYEDK